MNFNKIVVSFIIILKSASCIYSQYLNDSTKLFYQKILQHNSTSPFAHYGLALWYFNNNMYSAALKHSKNNIKKINDFDTVSHIILARSFEMLGRYKKAEHVYKKSLKKFPHSFQLWYHYGFYQYKLRNYVEAQHAIKKSIALYPYFALSHYLMGLILFEHANNRNCIHAFLYGLMIDTDTLQSISALAFVNNYLNKNFQNIEIPFFEKRLNLKSANDLLNNVYVSDSYQLNFYKSFQPLLFVQQLFNFLTDLKPHTKNIYVPFYNALVTENLIEPFLWVCLKNIPNSQISSWYLANNSKLMEFANFLDKNLISSRKND